MSHEPECPHNDSVCDCQITECSACHCPSIRAAYKRGREDAAKDTGAYVITNLDSKLETADFLDGLWNAARGGEQE